MEIFHICLRNKPIGTSTSSRLLFDSNSALPRLNRSSGLSPIVATPHTLPIYINSSSRNSHAIPSRRLLWPGSERDCLCYGLCVL